MGMPAFEQDPACTSVPEAVRLLLKPSFHPELCLTFVEGKVSVVCARSMIWRQFEPAPMITDRADGALSAGVFNDLTSSIVPISHPGAVQGIMIDGMPAEALHFQGGSVNLKIGGNAGRKGIFRASSRTQSSQRGPLFRTPTVETRSQTPPSTSASDCLVSRSLRESQPSKRWFLGRKRIASNCLKRSVGVVVALKKHPPSS